MTTPATPPTLRSLALDSIANIAAALRAKDRTLTRAQSIAKAAQTREGREAHRLYNAPEAHLPWTDAIKAMTERAKLEKASGGRSRKVASPPNLAPSDAVFVKIREEALNAAPAGRSEAGAIADFLQTSEGQRMWRTYNAALQAEGNS